MHRGVATPLAAGATDLRPEKVVLGTSKVFEFSLQVSRVPVKADLMEVSFNTLPEFNLVVRVNLPWIIS